MILTTELNIHHATIHPADIYIKILTVVNWPEVRVSTGQVSANLSKITY
jgi:hypothetical protein